MEKLLLITGKPGMIAQKNGSEELFVDARLLHQRLNVSTKFTTWFQRKVDEFSFEEGKDFFKNFSKSTVGRKTFDFPNLGNQKTASRGGDQRSIDYLLTLDMAKELAMLERNEIGRKVRSYFIAAEKQAREAANTGRMLPKGVKSIEINGRRLYPYAKLALKLGFKSGGSLYARRKRYPNHFVDFNKIQYVTEEMANLMAMTRSVYNHRRIVREMQPVLPFGFGETLELGGLQ